jgi:3-hydroxybutyryl-CoA dehydrogenase
MSITRETRIGIVGAGAMGSGIAQIAAGSGHPVVVVDANAAALARGASGVERAIQREAEKKRMDSAAAAAAIARVQWYHAPEPEALDALAGCELVIEAVVEVLDAKRDLFVQLERVVSAECILATNTSSLPVAAIAAVCTHPERVLGVHFFNPAPVMALVEIIPALGTAPGVTAHARALVDSWGKTTVLASDTPGFIVNRIARPFYGEGLRLNDEGIADPATIDWAMREFGGFRMGPFELMDLIGHDVNFTVTRSIFEAFFYDPRYKPSITQQRLVDAGMLGRKSGRGFYDYREGASRPKPREDRQLGAEIFERILVMLINEAVDAVLWRVASPADIDLAVLKGVNYPKGLLAWGDAMGLDRVLTRLTALEQEYGEDRYRPSALLKRMVREGRRFT